MLKIRTDLRREWKQETAADGIRFSFPAPKDAKGRIPCGFVFTNDSAADWTGWYGLELAVEGPASEEPAQLSITVEFFSREPLSLTVPLLLSDGKAHVELPFFRWSRRRKMTGMPSPLSGFSSTPLTFA